MYDASNTALILAGLPDEYFEAVARLRGLRRGQDAFSIDVAAAAIDQLLAECALRAWDDIHVVCRDDDDDDEVGEPPADLVAHLPLYVRVWAPSRVVPSDRAD